MSMGPSSADTIEPFVPSPPTNLDPLKPIEEYIVICFMVGPWR